jgi:hypothetical protein
LAASSDEGKEAFNLLGCGRLVTSTENHHTGRVPGRITREIAGFGADKKKIANLGIRFIQIIDSDSDGSVEQSGLTTSIDRRQCNKLALPSAKSIESQRKREIRKNQGIQHRSAWREFARVFRGRGSAIKGRLEESQSESKEISTPKCPGSRPMSANCSPRPPRWVTQSTRPTAPSTPIPKCHSDSKHAMKER